MRNGSRRGAITAYTIPISIDRETKGITLKYGSG